MIDDDDDAGDDGDSDGDGNGDGDGDGHGDDDSDERGGYGHRQHREDLDFPTTEPSSSFTSHFTPSSSVATPLPAPSESVMPRFLPTKIKVNHVSNDADVMRWM